MQIELIRVLIILIAPFLGPAITVPFGYTLITLISRPTQAISMTVKKILILFGITGASAVMIVELVDWLDIKTSAFSQIAYLPRNISFIWTLIIGLFAAICMYIAYQTLLFVMNESLPAASKSVRSTKLRLNQSVFLLPRRYLLLSLFTVIMVSIFEELAFRGYIQSVIFQGMHSNFVAVILSSMIFGFAHLPYGYRVSIFAIIVGIILGITIAIVGNLLAVIIAHCAYDCYAIVYATFLRPPMGIRKS